MAAGPRSPVGSAGSASSSGFANSDPTGTSNSVVGAAGSAAAVSSAARSVAKPEGRSGATSAAGSVSPAGLCPVPPGGAGATVGKGAISEAAAKTTTDVIVPQNAPDAMPLPMGLPHFVSVLVSALTPGAAPSLEDPFRTSGLTAPYASLQVYPGPSPGSRTFQPRAHHAAFDR